MPDDQVETEEGGFGLGLIREKSQSNKGIMGSVNGKIEQPKANFLLKKHCPSGDNTSTSGSTGTMKK
jgi:hypothetical protein